jgi:hypothetical protein
VLVPCELLARLTEGKAASNKLNLYVIAYAIKRNGQPSLDIWQEELAIGSILPTLPLGCAVRFACQLTWRQPMSVPAENNGLR